MQFSSKNKLIRLSESAALSATFTLIHAIMFTIKEIHIPAWAWGIEFLLLTFVAFAIPRQPQRDLTPSQKRLLLFSSISAVILLIVLLIIIMLNPTN